MIVQIMEAARRGLCPGVDARKKKKKKNVQFGTPRRKSFFPIKIEINFDFCHSSRKGYLL